MRSHKKLVAILAAPIIIIAVYCLRNFLADWIRLSWRKALAWHINPWIFVFLLFATLFHYYKSWFQIAKGLYRKDKSEIARGVALNRTVWAIPYLYVLIFGRGYPWWVPAGVISWMVIAAIMFVRNLRKPEYVERMTHSWVGKIVARFSRSETKE